MIEPLESIADMKKDVMKMIDAIHIPSDGVPCDIQFAATVL